MATLFIYEQCNYRMQDWKYELAHPWSFAGEFHLCWDYHQAMKRSHHVPQLQCNYQT